MCSVNPQRALGLTILLLMIAPFTAWAEAAAAPPASIGVSPARLEITVQDRTTTGSATVLNMSDNPVHVKASVVNFDLDEDSNFRELPPASGTLPMAMMINPVEFTIPANGSQTVRFAILPERLQGTGEYRAMLFFSELVDTSNASVKLNFRLGMPIYASLGPVESVARIHDVEFEKTRHELSIDISSLGNAQVKPTGYYLWWPISDYPKEKKALSRVAELARNPGTTPPSSTAGGRLLTKPVFPGERRALIAKLDPPPDAGEYMLVFHMEAGGQQIQRAIEYVPSQVFIVDSD